jgi:hypothetical protein
MNFVTLPLHHFGDSSVNLPSKNSGDFWKNPFMGFRFDLNTSATHHNPIICTSKKQNACQRPKKQLQLNQKIFGGKFRVRILNQLQSKRKEIRRTRHTFTEFAEKSCSKFDDKHCKEIFSKQKFSSFTYDSIGKNLLIRTTK